MVNITNLTGATNIYQIVDYNNQVTGGIFGNGFIIVIFMILTMMFVNRYGLEKSILVSSFICFMFSITMVTIDLVNPLFILAFASILVLDGFWVFYSTRK